jgi:hypothetical protein
VRLFFQIASPHHLWWLRERGEPRRCSNLGSYSSVVGSCLGVVEGAQPRPLGMGRGGRHAAGIIGGPPVRFGPVRSGSLRNPPNKMLGELRDRHHGVCTRLTSTARRVAGPMYVRSAAAAARRLSCRRRRRPSSRGSPAAAVIVAVANDLGRLR